MIKDVTFKTEESVALELVKSRVLALEARINETELELINLRNRVEALEIRQQGQNIYTNC
ncbi:hypothetical protein MCHI_003866 [Candidatus Magnetoovum chiemensis]|nr:hypothetical protein MCHI_003866 [Candidatus Magnetoovum chiemensis]